MGRKLYDRQKERVPRLRGIELATVNQIVNANENLDITLKSINSLADVNTAGALDTYVLTYSGGENGMIKPMIKPMIRSMIRPIISNP